MSTGSDGRHALVVATARYSDPKLQHLRAPAADAERLAEVLRDPAKGNFDVEVLTDERYATLIRRIAGFFRDRRPNDLLLLHFSCHGVKDDRGDLYLAATDTELDLLSATGVSAAWLNDQISHTRSRRTVVLLDCCFSGSFPFGRRARSGTTVNAPEQFEGRGRAIITASSGMEYAYEGDHLNGEGQPSVFTEAVVEGLETGKADLDHDQLVSVDDLYGYVYDRVKESTPSQTPNRRRDRDRGEVRKRRPAGPAARARQVHAAIGAEGAPAPRGLTAGSPGADALPPPPQRIWSASSARVSPIPNAYIAPSIWVPRRRDVNHIALQIWHFEERPGRLKLPLTAETRVRIPVAALVFPVNRAFCWGQKWLWGQDLGAARHCGPGQQLKLSRSLALVSRQHIGVYVAVSEAAAAAWRSSAAWAPPLSGSRLRPLRSISRGVLRTRNGMCIFYATLVEEQLMTQALDTSLHERRRAERMRDPEFRAAYEQAAGEIAQTDYIIRTLDELRAEMGISKAELARRIDRNASSVRRLFTAHQARPELPLITAVAEALGLRIAIVPESAEAKKAVRDLHGGRKELIAA